MSMAKLFDLTGKVALVTGGNGGLGLAMAKGLALASHSAARRATGRNWPGPAATTPTRCSNGTSLATVPRPCSCWMSPWPSPASWACGP